MKIKRWRDYHPLERWRMKVQMVAAGLFALLAFTLWASVTYAEEPCPESLKDSNQIMTCYFPTYSNGFEIRGLGEEWIVTWGMCKAWKPGVWILFVDKHGRRTKLPTPGAYKCDVL